MLCLGGGEWLTFTKDLPGGAGVGGNCTDELQNKFYPINFERFFLHFKSKFHWLLQFYCITQNVCENFSKKLAFLCRETFEKVFSIHFKSLWYHSNSCMLLYNKWKMQIFELIARVNVDTTSCCQMMSYCCVDLNRN